MLCVSKCVKRGWMAWIAGAALIALSTACGGKAGQLSGMLTNPDEQHAVPQAVLDLMHQTLPEGVNNAAVPSTATLTTPGPTAIAVTFLYEIALYNNSLVYLMSDDGSEREMMIPNASMAIDPFGVGGPMHGGETYIMRHPGSLEVEDFGGARQLVFGVLANAYDPPTNTVRGWPTLPDMVDPCKNRREDPSNGLANAYTTNAAVNPEQCNRPAGEPLAEHFKLFSWQVSGFLGGQPFIAASWEDLRRDPAGNALEPYPVDHDFNDGFVAIQFRPLSPGPCGARSPGFWQGPNGRALITSDDLAYLGSIHLVNDNGTPYIPISAADLSNWLKGGDAKNMASQLSRQLAAAVLNMRHDLINPSAIVYAPNTQCGGTSGLATMYDLCLEASNDLAGNPFTPAGNPDRAHQGYMKDALDAANNNLNFRNCGL